MFDFPVDSFIPEAIKLLTWSDRSADSVDELTHTLHATHIRGVSILSLVCIFTRHPRKSIMLYIYL